jgi:hypothetical protein
MCVRHIWQRQRWFVKPWTTFATRTHMVRWPSAVDDAVLASQTGSVAAAWARDISATFECL